jgi:hypothetical protein
MENGVFVDVSSHLLPVDPKWDVYRADPRFGALLARCGFASTAGRAPNKEARAGS